MRWLIANASGQSCTYDTLSMLFAQNGGGRKDKFCLSRNFFPGQVSSYFTVSVEVLCKIWGCKMSARLDRRELIWSLFSASLGHVFAFLLFLQENSHGSHGCQDSLFTNVLCCIFCLGISLCCTKSFISLWEPLELFQGCGTYPCPLVTTLLGQHHLYLYSTYRSCRQCPLCPAV